MAPSPNLAKLLCKILDFLQSYFARFSAAPSLIEQTSRMRCKNSPQARERKRRSFRAKEASLRRDIKHLVPSRVLQIATHAVVIGTIIRRVSLAAYNAQVTSSMPALDTGMISKLLIYDPFLGDALYHILFNYPSLCNNLRNIQLPGGTLGHFVPVLLIVDFFQAPHPLQHQAVVQVLKQQSLAEPVAAHDREDHRKGASASHMERSASCSALSSSRP